MHKEVDKLTLWSSQGAKGLTGPSGPPGHPGEPVRAKETSWLSPFRGPVSAKNNPTLSFYLRECTEEMESMESRGELDRRSAWLRLFNNVNN